jgi:Holliday junction DNA helicase RuvA
MIAAVEGTLINKGTTSVIVKAGPVSFLLNVPGSTLARLGPTGSQVLLHTHLYVREDILALYGFSSPQELAIFEQLITVSGIGPKVALALLTTLDPGQMVTAIVSGNAELLSQVPGIGKKTAGRVILELKGKLEKSWVGEIMPSGITQADSDAISALTTLGYSLREATQALSNIQATESMPIEDKIRLALQQLAKR